MTKQQILEMTGLTEDEFYAQYPTEESFKQGGWIQKAAASIKRRGTEGKCTPMTKPGCTGRALALAKTFHKMAAKRKKHEDGGMVDYEKGGVVDVYQLMGMPTPSMYGMGGYAPIGTYSDVISQKNHSNMGYAMGGGVNGPNLLPVDTGNMPIFAMGGMTSQPTIINVEDGELLIDPKTNKILTKYLGGGMVRHPEYGQDIRGNVPVQTDDKNPKFVIPVKYADKFVKARKNNNTLEMEMYKNNITIEKAKNEAKDAQIAAAEEQKASKAMNRMMAKYGGTIQRMYAKGGMINKYADGDVVNAITNPLSLNNTAFGNVDMSAFNNPMTRFSGAAGFSNTPSSLNLNTSPMTMGQHLTGQTGSYMDYRNIPDTGIGYKGADTPPSDPNNFNYKDFMSQAIPYGVAASQVIEPLLQKPFKMKSQDYETPANMKWEDMTDEATRRDFERARAGMEYAARNIGGSNALAALTGGANEYYRNLGKFNEELANKNRMGRLEVSKLNKAIEQANLNQRMQMAMFNEQNRAARRNAIRQGVMNTAGTFYNQDASRMTKQGLSAEYPEYEFPWNKKRNKSS